MDVERTIEFLRKNQADSEVRMGKLEGHVTQLTQLVSTIAQQQAQFVVIVRENFERLTADVRDLIEAQKQTDERMKHTDERLNALIKIVDGWYNRPR
ncbi:MAG: hypothetical protein ACRD96_09360 [Bryobacteraceae bacterium]